MYLRISRFKCLPSAAYAAGFHPDALVDFHTPRLDLDSVYGRGNADQPYLYERHDPPGVNGDTARPLLGVEQHPVSVAASRPVGAGNAVGRAIRDVAARFMSV